MGYGDILLFYYNLSCEQMTSLLKKVEFCGFNWSLQQVNSSQRVWLAPTRRKYFPVGSTPASLPATVGFKPNPLR
jgi:hypothetical protein